MKKLLLLLAVLLPLAVSAQDKYCATYQDFLADVWQTVGAEAQLQLLPSAKEDSLALELKAKGADRKLRHILKRCFALEYGGQLYLNLRGFNRFGDVFVRAWRMGADKLVFARPVIGYNDQLDVTFNLNSRMGKKLPFQGYYTLKDLVCYVVGWDPERAEARLGRIKPSEDAETALRELMEEGLIK